MWILTNTIVFFIHPLLTILSNGIWIFGLAYYSLQKDKTKRSQAKKQLKKEF